MIKIVIRSQEEVNMRSTRTHPDQPNRSVQQQQLGDNAPVLNFDTGQKNFRKEYFDPRAFLIYFSIFSIKSITCFRTALDAPSTGMSRE